MPGSKPRRKDEFQGSAVQLSDLIGLLGGAMPSDSVLARLQNELEDLADAAQSYVKNLDRQLDKITKATSQVGQEIAKRENQKAQKPAASQSHQDVTMDDAPSDDDDGASRTTVKSETSSTQREEDTNGSTEVAETGDSAKSQAKHFVPNPKSEFVASQELPVSALALFEETPGDEGIKKKLAVASYPQHDLQDMLAGPVPDEDYTRAKPPNQIQFTTFATFLEPFFRAFNEEDLSFLQQKSVGHEVVSYGRIISPYTVPPLGPLYTDTWAEEDGANPGYTVSAPPKTADKARYTPVGGYGNLTDDEMEIEKVAVGPLTARLMSALLPEDGDEDSEALPSLPPAVTEIPQGPSLAKRPFPLFSGLEERLRREFLYVGIVDMNILRQDERKKRQFKLAVEVPVDSVSWLDNETEIDWVNGTEDDEVSRELRELQGKLRTVSANNQKYKRRLLPYIEEQMAWQEYSSILDDLDKQVEQAYLKRLRVPKAKKKKTTVATTPATPIAVSASTPKIVDQKPAIRAVLDKRQRWYSKIGSVFPPAHVIMRSHETPKFEGDDDEEEEVEEDET